MFLIFLANIFYRMYRHLSPKVGAKDKPDDNRPKHITGSPPIFAQRAPKKEVAPAPRQKEIKNLGNLLSNKPPPPPTPGLVNLNKSSERHKPGGQKTGSAFDDYYEKKPKVPRDKKEEISLSGDSYQSENFNGLKKAPNSPKSLAAERSQKKNLVVPVPSDARQGFKSPPNRPPQRTDSEEDKSGKRILSFGGKKLMAGRFLEDGDATSKKSGEASTGHKTPASPLIAKGRFPGLYMSDGQSKGENPKGKNLPKFIANANIKSSPYLAKYALDSSNEQSGQRSGKPTVKPKFEPLLQQLRNNNKERQGQKEKDQKQKDQDKSLSFNRGELFLNLKKRQERHSLLCKEMNMLGLKVELKAITVETDRLLDFILVKKISESKRTGIFLGYHQKTASLYCLKRSPVSQGRKSLIPEAIRQHKIHQMCCHPHIVKSFSTAVEGSHIYLLMEFMQGQTLGHELRTQVMKSMSEQSAAKTRINQSVTTQISKINRIRKILYEIAGAVVYIHERGIVHRDIKPDNIFVSHDTYKLGDFGSAALVGVLEYVGTLDYAAPQILLQAPYDQKVDIWSLGCIAYQLDVGRPPFFHINPDQTRRLAANGDFDRSLIGDPELRGLIERMLQVNRKNRLSARQLIKHEFFQQLQEEGSPF